MSMGRHALYYCIGRQWLEEYRAFEPLLNREKQQHAHMIYLRIWIAIHCSWSINSAMVSSCSWRHLFFMQDALVHTFLLYPYVTVAARFELNMCTWIFFFCMTCQVSFFLLYCSCDCFLITNFSEIQLYTSLSDNKLVDS